jgi:hypothetical protein
MRRRFSWLVATLGALLGLTLVPGTATASVANWISDPSTCDYVSTVAERKSGDLFVQLRRGKCGSTYYIWARANGNRVVGLGVYTSSMSLIATDKTQNGSGNTHYTRGRRAKVGEIYLGGAGWATISYSP